MQQTRVSVYRTIGPLVLFFCNKKIKVQFQDCCLFSIVYFHFLCVFVSLTQMMCFTTKCFVILVKGYLRIFDIWKKIQKKRGEHWWSRSSARSQNQKFWGLNPITHGTGILVESEHRAPCGNHTPLLLVLISCHASHSTAKVIWRWVLCLKYNP